MSYFMIVCGEDEEDNADNQSDVVFGWEVQLLVKFCCQKYDVTEKVKKAILKFDKC